MFIQIQDMLMLFDSALCLWRLCIKKSAIVIIKYLGREVWVAKALYANQRFCNLHAPIKDVSSF